jgi:hypothetical protein
MVNFHKSHGKHCYYRSFQSNCPRCGVDVLYWECRHGCKIFFNYPPYGKLIQHRCRSYKGKKIKNKYPVIVKKPKGLLEEASPSCPVCGKLFKNQNDLDGHLKYLKRNDNQHKQFFNGDLLFIDEIRDKKLKESEKTKINTKPKFGAINIKKRNQ